VPPVLPSPSYTSAIPTCRRRDNLSRAVALASWGLYSEKVAGEVGFYATEPDGSEGYALLGHFGDELLRAARLVVDTGLHAMGWTREEAIEYMRVRGLYDRDVISSAMQ
jgi:uncharacterized protein (DUF885 family)